MPPAPISLQCYQEGSIYSENDPVPHPDPCQYCLCLNGRVVCAARLCQLPPELEGRDCQPLTPPAGLCCPAEYSCGESDGQTDRPRRAVYRAVRAPAGSLCSIRNES